MVFFLIIGFHLSGISPTCLVTSTRSTCLRHFAATIVAFLAVPHSCTRLARVVYSFVLDSFHTKCVGEETFKDIKKEIDRKKHLKHSP